MQIPKSVFVVFYLIVFAALIFYPASGTGQDHHKVELVYWHGWTGFEEAMLQKLVDRFNREHPDIHVKAVSVMGSYQKVRLVFASGSGPDALSACWWEEMASYAARGVIEPLDSYMKASNWDERDLMPAFRKYLQYKGHYYGLIHGPNSYFVAYNKKAFRECGVTKLPETLDEFEDAIAKTTQRRADGSYVRYGMRPSNLVLWGYVFGGKWYDEKTGKITANDPKNVEALRWLVKMSKKYDINKMEAFEQTFGNSMSGNNAFFSGKQTMVFIGEWIDEYAHKYAPNMEWGVFPIPAPPGGRRGVVTLGGSLWVVPSAGKHKKEAWEFISWMCSPQAEREFSAKGGALSCHYSNIGNPAFTRLPVQNFGMHLISSPTSVFGPPPIPTWIQYQAAILNAEDYAVHGSEDPQKLLDNLTVTMQKDLDRIRKGH
jgi:multiple sugar transport system substrate-binding protein